MSDCLEMARSAMLRGALVLMALVGGCRREDIHTAVIQLPNLVEADKAKIIEAFTIRKPGQPPRCYEGVKPEDFQFDFAAKTLIVHYDSMKIAKTNIRMIIENAGVAVSFPTNTTGIAGYLDRKVADDVPPKRDMSSGASR